MKAESQSTGGTRAAAADDGWTVAAGLHDAFDGELAKPIEPTAEWLGSSVKELLGGDAVKA